MTSNELTTLLPINDLLAKNYNYTIIQNNITEVDEDLSNEIKNLVRNTGSAQYRNKSKNNPF